MNMKKNNVKNKKTWLPAICDSWFVMLLIVHLLTVPIGGYAIMGAWKWRSFLVLSVLFLLAGVMAILHDSRPFRFERRDVPLLLWLAISTLSTACSPYSGAFLGTSRQEGLLTLLLYGGTTLVLSRGFQAKGWMLWLTGSVLCLFCSLGFIQLTGGNPFKLYPVGFDFYDGDIYYAGKYWSTIGNTGLCGAILIMACGLFALYQIRGQKYRQLAAVPLALAVFSIVELQIEACLLALLIGFPLLLPAAVRSRKELAQAAEMLMITAGAGTLALGLEFGRGRLQFVISTAVFAGITAILLFLGLCLLLRRGTWECSALQLQRKIVIFLVIASLTSAGVLWFCENLPVGFLQEAHLLLRKGWNDDYGSGRLYIWRQVWALVPERPLLGGGPDTLSLRGISWNPTFDPVSGLSIRTVVDAAHCEPLNVLANQGVLGLTTWLLVMGQALLRAWRRREELCPLLCGSSILLYLFQSLFGISMPITAPFLWLAVGILLAE